MTDDRDNSLSAIRRRYEKANEQAIIMHDRIAFDSLRDIFYLLDLVQKLKKELEESKKT
jgi:hypothetical protein